MVVVVSETAVTVHVQAWVEFFRRGLSQVTGHYLLFSPRRYPELDKSDGDGTKQNSFISNYYAKDASV